MIVESVFKGLGCEIFIYTVNAVFVCMYMYKLADREDGRNYRPFIPVLLLNWSIHTCAHT